MNNDLRGYQFSGRGFGIMLDLFGHDLAADSCFVFGRGGGGVIYGQQFGRQPMSHQDNLVLTRRVMVIPRGPDRMKHGSTCPEHGQIIFAQN